MKPFKIKYGLSNYVPDFDRDGPLVVFGCYTKAAADWVIKHRGLTVIVWSGSDAMHLKKWKFLTDYLLDNQERVFHIAYSKWIIEDLEAVGLRYIKRPVFPVTFEWLKFEPEHEGMIYHYHSRSKGAMREFYGTDMVDDLEKRNRLPFVKTAFGHVGMKSRQLYDYYKKSSFGVRLTPHDNMALSCVEMGLMGRYSIFNGNIPCALNYGDRDNARAMIIEMAKNMPQPDKLLAEEMREFVHDDQKWLNTEYYD